MRSRRYFSLQEIYTSHIARDPFKISSTNRSKRIELQDSKHSWLHCIGTPDGIVNKNWAHTAECQKTYGGTSSTRCDLFGTVVGVEPTLTYE